MKIKKSIVTNTEVSLNDIAKAKADLQKVISQQGKLLIDQAIKPVFDNNPSVKKIIWNQYTPYFMDGDPCVFGLSELVLQVEEDSTPNREQYYEETYFVPEDIQNEPNSFFVYSVKNGSFLKNINPTTQWNPYLKNEYGALIYEHQFEDVRKLGQAKLDVTALLNSNEDILEQVFGDHVVVVASKDGYETYDYEHD